MSALTAVSIARFRIVGLYHKKLQVSEKLARGPTRISILLVNHSFHRPMRPTPSAIRSKSKNTARKTNRSGSCVYSLAKFERSPRRPVKACDGRHQLVGVYRFGNVRLEAGSYSPLIGSVMS